jgi:hypothetical protein
MKTYLLSLCFLLALLPVAHAQIGFNSPAGITPQLDAEIYTNNGFLVQERFIVPPGQQKAIHPFCGSAPIDVSGDLLAPAYAAQPASVTSLCFSTVRCPARPIGRRLVGVQITVNWVSVATANNDRIWLRFNTPTGPQSYSFGFPVVAPPNSFSLQQTFRVALGAADDEFRAEFFRGLSSPAGMRFYVRWQYLWGEDLSRFFPFPFPPAFRHAFLFDTFRGALRAGTPSLTDLMAMGDESVALGFENQALGPNSLAFGMQNIVRGSGGVGIGSENVIEGKGAVGMGFGNRAEAKGAIAIGTNVLADALGAVAIGQNLSTNKQPGTFVIGDSDPTGEGPAPVNQSDQFVARFRNGYQLFASGAGKQAGVFMSQGQNSWGSISDSTKKERLLPMNHADVLRKIGAMKLSSWNYKGQRTIRHYGPMAQDFYAAFGHDDLGPIGCDTLIYSHDFAGVTFAAVQALIRENERLQAELAQEKAHNAHIQADFSNRLHLLERAVLTRRERVTLRKTNP